MAANNSNQNNGPNMVPTNTSTQSKNSINGNDVDITTVPGMRENMFSKDVVIQEEGVYEYSDKYPAKTAIGFYQGPTGKLVQVWGCPLKDKEGSPVAAVVSPPPSPGDSSPSGSSSPTTSPAASPAATKETAKHKKKKMNKKKSSPKKPVPPGAPVAEKPKLTGGVTTAPQWRAIGGGVYTPPVKKVATKPVAEVAGGSVGAAPVPESGQPAATSESTNSSPDLGVVPGPVVDPNAKPAESQEEKKEEPPNEPKPQ